MDLCVKTINILKCLSIHKNLYFSCREQLLKWSNRLLGPTTYVLEQSEQIVLRRCPRTFEQIGPTWWTEPEIWTIDKLQNFAREIVIEHLKIRRSQSDEESILYVLLTIPVSRYVQENRFGLIKSEFFALIIAFDK